MAFISGTAPTGDTFEAGHRRLFRVIRRLVTGCPAVGTVGYTGTGNGVIGHIDTEPGDPTETWTITFTDATNFTVTGSVSGAKSAGTVGVDYDDQIAFRINAGATPFVATDVFTIPVTVNTDVTGNDRWIIDRWNPHAGDLELIMHGVGLAGTDEIYLAWRVTETPASQFYHWRQRGLTGFSSGDVFSNQPGASTEVWCAVWDQSHPYWLSVNGRRIILTARASTSYHTLYGGFFLPYGTPLEYPYPIMAAGDHSGTLLSFNDLGLDHFLNAAPGSGGVASGYLRRIDGTWVAFDRDAVNGISFWPYQTVGVFRNIFLQVETIGADSVLMPVTILDGRGSSGSSLAGCAIIGTVDGVFALPGFGVSPEDVITIGGDDYRVFPNVTQIGRADFWAQKEE